MDKILPVLKLLNMIGGWGSTIIPLTIDILTPLLIFALVTKVI